MKIIKMATGSYIEKAEHNKRTAEISDVTLKNIPVVHGAPICGHVCGNGFSCARSCHAEIKTELKN